MGDGIGTTRDGKSAPDDSLVQGAGGPKRHAFPQPVGLSQDPVPFPPTDFLDQAPEAGGQ